MPPSRNTSPSTNSPPTLSHKVTPTTPTLKTLTSILQNHRRQSSEQVPLLQHAQPHTRSPPAIKPASKGPTPTPTSYRPPPSPSPFPEPGRTLSPTLYKGEKPRVYTPKNSPTPTDEIARIVAETQSTTLQPKPKPKPVAIAKPPTGLPTPKTSHPVPKSKTQSLVRKLLTRASSSFGGGRDPKRVGYAELGDGEWGESGVWKVDGEGVERKLYHDEGVWEGNEVNSKDKSTLKRANPMKSKPGKTVRSTEDKDGRPLRNQENRGEIEEVERAEKTTKEKREKRVLNEWYFGN